ncbi:MAG TPA: hypothetical protein VD695_04300 [Gaiellaceae bacterium]|nr:hypothetical protein [Gaiellaceae bacterium]HXV95749.1 hypothetical protein [Gaiellaceae bacterium]
MRKKLTALTVGVAAMLVAAPAQAALDEGGGAASTPAALPAADGFDWADAGIGAGIGALAVAALGAGAVARRHHGHTVARPAAH